MIKPTADHASASAIARPDWRGRYARNIAVTDVLVLLWVIFGTQIVWFGTGAAEVAMRNDLRISSVSYWLFSILLVVVWSLVLGLFDTRDHRVIGAGSDEYKRIFHASLRLFGAIAILAFLFRIDVARGYLLIALPVGVCALWLSRWLWRQWLSAQRESGSYSARVLLVGRSTSVLRVARDLARNPYAGYWVVGACVPSGSRDDLEALGVPIWHSVDDVHTAMSVTGADTVAVTGAEELPAEKVREISWGLESGRQHLVVAPAITDVGGPRITTRPVAGLPLIHIETPRFSRAGRISKRLMDLVLTGVIIVLTAPLLLGTAIAVRVSSPGPIFFRQERVGLQGKPFTMLKFRSMRVGADAELASLLKEQGTSQIPLFKVKNDPRITPIGTFIRKYSLDELPQLFNVFGGSMSLVGPRPQVAAEVALYSDAARRRLLARPGITGLWQVSGRSNLSWEESVRLDLYYVENWSLVGDLTILWRTAKAVLTSDGSY
ncbi:sugar transferase [Leucobacter sp. W1153]|uniref:sugar transferase n=1 Tax=Leucobacter sp. W1153 TaxID=3439064 RepID=UPI003F2F4787